MFNQKGFTLLEVLIAMCILAIFLLGISELQLASLNANREAFLQHIASEQLSSMAAVMHMHINCNDYIRHWYLDNKKLLPHSKSRIKKQGGQYVLSINWKSFGSNLWHCKAQQLPNQACIELRISA